MSFPAWRRLFSKHVDRWVFPSTESKVFVCHERKADRRVQFRGWSYYNYKLVQHHGDDLEQVSDVIYDHTGMHVRQHDQLAPNSNSR